MLTARARALRSRGEYAEALAVVTAAARNVVELSEKLEALHEELGERPGARGQLEGRATSRRGV